MVLVCLVMSGSSTSREVVVGAWPGSVKGTSEAFEVRVASDVFAM